MREDLDRAAQHHRDLVVGMAHADAVRAAADEVDANAHDLLAEVVESYPSAMREELLRVGRAHVGAALSRGWGSSESYSTVLERAARAAMDARMERGEQHTGEES